MTGSAHAAGAIATSAIALPALGFALGPLFEKEEVRWEAVGRPSDFRLDDLHPEGLHRDPGHRRGRQDDGLRAQAQPERSTSRRRTSTTSSSRSRRAACTSAARSATPRPPQRFICPCHGGVYDFRGKRIGGPPVRPLDRFYTRVRNGKVEIGPRYSVELRARSASRRATRASRSTASASTSTRRVPTRAEALDAQAQAPAPAAPRRAQARRRPGPARRQRAVRSRRAKEAGITAVDWVDERTSLSGAARWLMFRKVPKGTNWFYTLGSATMFAFLNQAITGVFLAMYYDPSPTRAYESARYITNEAFLGEFVRGMHKWGSTVMVDPRLPAHGAHVLLRRLQVPARAELDHRRRPADPHDGDVVHRLPAARSTSAPTGPRSSA